MTALADGTGPSWGPCYCDPEGRIRCLYDCSPVRPEEDAPEDVDRIAADASLQPPSALIAEVRQHRATGRRLARDVLAEIDRQRTLRWPDFHPEDYCHRCGGPNIGWFAPSPLWNAVMGDPMEWEGIVCPHCFTKLAKQRGVVAETATWRLSTTTTIVDLPTSHPDGRVWDPVADLWVERPGDNEPDAEGTS